MSNETDLSTELTGDLVSLPDRRWRLWRWVRVRAAGFPSASVLRLADSRSASLLDEADVARSSLEEAVARVSATLGVEVERAVLRKVISEARAGRVAPGVHGRARLLVEEVCEAALRSQNAEARAAAAFAEGDESVRRALRATAADPLFREAVLWQNADAKRDALDHVADPATKITSRLRKRERLVAMYLQRYALKNDTIGFFGPSCWATIASQPEPLEVKPGEKLLSKRDVFFEVWCIQALADSLSRLDGVRPWICPRLLTYYRVADGILHKPGGDTVDLGWDPLESTCRHASLSIL